MRIRTCPTCIMVTGIELNGGRSMRRHNLIALAVGIAAVLALAWWLVQALIRSVTLD